MKPETGSPGASNSVIRKCFLRIDVNRNVLGVCGSHFVTMRCQISSIELIWQRMVTSQMAAAIFENVTIDIDAKKTLSKTRYTLRAQSSKNTFPGFMALYIEGRDEKEEEAKTPPLPPLSEAEMLKSLDPKTSIKPEQHFTQPPPRFTEATLVKTLEQYGIGRPSTYAPILSVVQEREYVTKEKGAFKPTELGMAVSDLLVQQFPEVIDTGFTAQMEDKLDKVADEGLDWVKVVRGLLHALRERPDHR